MAKTRLVRAGGRGFALDTLRCWWSDGEVVTLVLREQEYLTFAGAERITVLHWLQVNRETIVL